MFTSISWQQYITAIFTITVIYYLFILLRYYRAEAAGIMTHSRNHEKLFPADIQKQFGIIGKVVPEQVSILEDSQNLMFGEAVPDEEIVLVENSTAAYQEPDQTEEFIDQAENLKIAFKDIDNKNEFLSLLGILIDSYKRSSAKIDFNNALSRLIDQSPNTLPFKFSLDEISA